MLIDTVPANDPMHKSDQSSSCLVCGALSGAPIYRCGDGLSVTSGAQLIAQPTFVFACERCGHVQTPPLSDIATYYDTVYNHHLESQDSDDLYSMSGDRPIYRAEHQADVVQRKLELRPGALVLDYGCAKSRTLRALLEARPDIEGAVFDVSDSYRGAWNSFITPTNQAAYRIPAAWLGRFDAVLSFFALEHVADPRGFLATIHGLLRPGGAIHLVVPNPRRNTGDLIVIDHVNHFMPTSLKRVFHDAGFSDIEIDEEAHDAAYVINARRGAPPSFASCGDDVAKCVAQAIEMATFWSGAGEAVTAFERHEARGRRSAIYGSAFYGVFIASRLIDFSNVAYFLDRNPFQQSRRVLDRPVLRPQDVGDDIDVIYAGLNPAQARGIIYAIPQMARRDRDFFFL